MVECQWDSVVLSPYSPVLTGLEVTFMCLTRSNSSLFSPPGFVVSSVGKRERGGERKTHTHTHTHKEKKTTQKKHPKKTKTKMGRREKGTRKEGKEGRREEGIKKERRQDKKEF